MIAPEMKTPPADSNAPVTSKYTEAYNLNVRICVNAQMAQQNLYEVCKGLKEMRDGKLYKELGYQNFEEYTENEVGFGRRQAYRMIDIASKLPTDFVTSMSQIGMTKLSLLTKLDEPQREEIQHNTDLESVSVRELKEQIKKLETARTETETELTESKRRNKNLVQKNIELVEQVKELENRPVEVAVQQDTSEIDRLKEELTASEDKHRTEIDRIRSEYEQRLAEKPAAQDAQSASSDSKEIFRAYLANVVDALERLTAYMEQCRHDANMHFFMSRLQQIMSITDEKLNEWKGE